MTSMKSIALVAAIACASIVYPSMADTYVSGFGGLNYDDVNKPLGSDSGYVVGGALGTSIKSVPGLRAEVEASFRQNDVSFYSIKASHETTALMGNLAYDADLGLGRFKPYVLAGIGYAQNKGTIENISLASVEAQGFAWQLGAGVNAEVVDGVKVGIGYRYLQTPDIKILGYQVSDGSNSAVLASLTLSLN